jgi:hypothetical protein
MNNLYDQRNFNKGGAMPCPARYVKRLPAQG